MSRTLFKTTKEHVPFILHLALGGVIFPHGAQMMLGWFGGQGLRRTMELLTQHLHIRILFAWLTL
jgi:putative oxidoreductase